MEDSLLHIIHLWEDFGTEFDQESDEAGEVKLVSCGTPRTARATPIARSHAARHAHRRGAELRPKCIVSSLTWGDAPEQVDLAAGSRRILP